MRRLLFLGTALLLLLGSCSDSSPRPDPQTNDPTTLRLVATSPAIVALCDFLELPLVGVPTSARTPTPARYEAAQSVGVAMTPDLERIAVLRPDMVLSPLSLAASLRPQYEAAGLPHRFLDLRSITGLFASLTALSQTYGGAERLEPLVREFERNQTRTLDRESPRVLILMGLPGSFVAATEHSYVGSLVLHLGGRNIVQPKSTEEEFVAVDTESLLAADPDVILRTAHTMPEEVLADFAAEFETNDIWRHFRAVSSGRVHDLPSELFGMSADLSYPKALALLEPLLHPPGKKTEVNTP